MKRVLSTRQGFFAFAAIVCWATLLVIEPEHRWVSLGLGCLYAVLAVLFYLDELGRATAPHRPEKPTRRIDPTDRSPDTVADAGVPGTEM
jgi:hypothetical protein